MGLALLGLTAPALAHAEFVLLGVGVLDGSKAGTHADLSGLKGTLENGVAANVLDGTGSALDYAGGNLFLALPDRGPNAKPYNEAIDNTSSYISRFHTVAISLKPAPAGSATPFLVQPELRATTLLFSPIPLAYGDGKAAGLGTGAPAENKADRYYFTGRSDNFAAGRPSTDPGHARLDPEGIRLSHDGRSVFVSDEYGPAIYQFDRASGRRLKSFALPAKFAVTQLELTEKAEIAANRVGRTTNKGLEGLAITPDGRTLVGMMQAALLQDAAAPETKKLLRIVAIDIATGKVREYGYKLTTGSGVSEFLAINDHDFLVLERDGGGLGEKKPAVAKALYRIDLTGAKEIGDLAGAEAAAAAVPKTEALDIVTLLTGTGIPADKIPGKLEGISFGPDQMVGGKKLHTLYMANDNDFLPEAAGPDYFYVIGFSDEDIPGLGK
jgi:hypothetical protein